MKADLQTQIDFEMLYDKNQVNRRLREEFNQPEIIDRLNEAEIPFQFGISLLSQMVLHKRASVSVLVGILHHHFKDEDNEFQACADMLLKAALADLVDYSEVARTFVVRIEVSQDVIDDLERYQYPLPCLIPPNVVKNNSESGYFNSDSSIILRHNHHDDDVCLDHINRMNRIKFSINPETVKMIQNKWKNLDKKKPNESDADYKKRVKAFEKYDRSSRDIIDHLMMFDNEFYLTNKYDKRGRCYTQGYHVNPQGNDWNKAVIEFADKEICPT